MDVDTSVRAFVLAVHFMSPYGWTPAEPVIYPSWDACVSAGNAALDHSGGRGNFTFWTGDVIPLGDFTCTEGYIAK